MLGKISKMFLFFGLLQTITFTDHFKSMFFMLLVSAWNNVNKLTEMYLMIDIEALNYLVRSPN